MRAPYRPSPSKEDKVDFYPTIRVSVGKKHAQRSRPFEALVDSGATICIFHHEIAKAIGLKIENGRKEQMNGIGGPQDVWMHPVQLFVGGELLEIEAGFAKTLPVAGILGRKGFFQFFKITFDPSSEPPGLELERIHKA